MITFDSPTIPDKKWKICFKSKKEMSQLYYGEQYKDNKEIVFGITDFDDVIVYLNKEIKGFVLSKTLKHELMHVFLFDSEKRSYLYSNENASELINMAAPYVYNTSTEILLKIKDENNKIFTDERKI